MGQTHKDDEAVMPIVQIGLNAKRYVTDYQRNSIIIKYSFYRKEKLRGWWLFLFYLTTERQNQGSSSLSRKQSHYLLFIKWFLCIGYVKLCLATVTHNFKWVTQYYALKTSNDVQH